MADPFKSKFKGSDALEDVHRCVRKEAQAESIARAHKLQKVQEELHTQGQRQAHQHVTEVKTRLRLKCQRQTVHQHQHISATIPGKSCVTQRFQDHHAQHTHKVHILSQDLIHYETRM